MVDSTSVRSMNLLNLRNSLPFRNRIDVGTVNIRYWPDSQDEISQSTMISRKRESDTIRRDILSFMDLHPAHPVV